MEYKEKARQAQYENIKNIILGDGSDREKREKINLFIKSLVSSNKKPWEQGKKMNEIRDRIKKQLRSEDLPTTCVSLAIGRSQAAEEEAQIDLARKKQQKIVPPGAWAAEKYYKARDNDEKN